MAKTTATKLQDKIEMVRREAFAAGYVAAMKYSGVCVALETRWCYAAP
jgi:hypothetical protein